MKKFPAEVPGEIPKENMGWILGWIHERIPENLRKESWKISLKEFRRKPDEIHRKISGKNTEEYICRNPAKIR